MYISQLFLQVVVKFHRNYFPNSSNLKFTAWIICTVGFLLSNVTSATVVRMETSLGNIDIELFDDEAPITVGNFLTYAGSGLYTNNGFIHRHASINTSGVSVIQGGGYEYFQPFPELPDVLPVRRIRTFPKIKNEFSPLRSNVRGRIAMAKTSDPDSATSEWFINYGDNSAALDNPNNSGGFTVFGRVVDGMDVVDAITNLTVQPSRLYTGDGTEQSRILFNELPVLQGFDPTDLDMRGKLVMVTRIPNVAGVVTNPGTLEIFTADVDMVFDDVRTIDTTTAATLLTTFTPPPNQSAHFNNGMFTLKLTGTMGTTGRVITLYDGALTRPTRYYAYGPTPDKPSPHWYDFTFDGETGAEIENDRIILHFVDGKRGDDDLDTTNGSITHTGAQAVLTTTNSVPSAQSGGCSIATTPSNTSRVGDWLLVSLFLVFLAVIRKRARRQRF